MPQDLGHANSYLVLVNSKSGMAREYGPSRLQENLLHAFAGIHRTADVRFTHPRKLEDEIGAAIEKAQQNTAIVVGGGDGSLSTAARLLSGTDIPLGILPLGTMNLMARAIGMPLDPVQAVHALTTACATPIDLLDIGGRCAMMHASIGLQPKIIRIREVLPYRTRFSRIINGMIAWIRVTRKLKRLRITGATDKETFAREASAVLISNNVLPEGLGEAPMAYDLSGGRVAIYVVGSNKRSELVKLALATSLGIWRQSDLVEEFVTTELEIDTDKQSLLVSVDGELVPFDTPFTVSIASKALSVLMPDETAA